MVCGLSESKTLWRICWNNIEKCSCGLKWLRSSGNPSQCNKTGIWLKETYKLKTDMAVMHNDKSIILLTTMNIFWPTEVTKLVRVLFDQRKYNLNVGALGCGYIISVQHNSWHCACLRVIIFVEGIFFFFFAAAEPEGASIILFQFFFGELYLCIACVLLLWCSELRKVFQHFHPTSKHDFWFLRIL